MMIHEINTAWSEKTSIEDSRNSESGLRPGGAYAPEGKMQFHFTSWPARSLVAFHYSIIPGASQNYKNHLSPLALVSCIYSETFSHATYLVEISLG